MTDPTHGEILRAIGNLEGEIKGIKSNAERMNAISAKMDAIHEEVSKIQLWKAEMRGMGIGVKAGFLLAAGTVGAGFVKGLEWLVQKVN